MKKNTSVLGVLKKTWIFTQVNSSLLNKTWVLKKFTQNSMSKYLTQHCFLVKKVKKVIFDFFWQKLSQKKSKINSPSIMVKICNNGNDN